MNEINQKLYDKTVLCIQMARIGKSKDMQNLADAFYNDIQALVEQQVLIGQRDTLLEFLDIWHNKDSFGTSDFIEHIKELDRQIQSLTGDKNE